MMTFIKGTLAAKGETFFRSLRVVEFLLIQLLLAWASQAGESAFDPRAGAGIFSTPLSLSDAVTVALAESPAIQKARKTLEADQGIVIQTRAVAIPKLGITGNYSAVQPSDVDKPPAVIPGFTFGNDQSWRAQVRLVQSIYEGGRILSSLRSARILKDRSLLSYNVAVADLVLDVQTSYYGVLAAEQQISVQEASVQLLTRELTDTTRRFEAGTVPRFNVLRAEVELANARPRLSRARNRSRIARNVLANVLGATVPQGAGGDIPLRLSDALTAEPLAVELPKAISLALEQRKELGVLRAAQALRKEEIVNASAGYKPSLQAFGGYDAHNSLFSSDLTDELHGWMAGVQLRWDIFDGRLTQGKVIQARAQYDLAGVELEDAARKIELDVRTAHSTFVEATEVLESQKKVLEQAEEALRLATARSEAGTGTQLDVLGAQTALTEARSTQVQALHEYSVARARLERAMGMNWPLPAH